MSGQQDRLPDTEINAVYYHLITAQQHDYDYAPEPLSQTEIQYDPEPELAYDFHPDDLDALVDWEQKTARSIALWLVLMTLVTVAFVPFAPFFTPLVALFFGIMSVLFYIRARLINEAQIIHDLKSALQRPTSQWMGGSFALAFSLFTYLIALLVPYSAMPAETRTLMFFVSMNFVLYTPIAIIRVIRQRTLRRKRRITG